MSNPVPGLKQPDDVLIVGGSAGADQRLCVSIAAWGA